MVIPFLKRKEKQYDLKQAIKIVEEHIAEREKQASSLALAANPDKWWQGKAIDLMCYGMEEIRQVLMNKDTSESKRMKKLFERNDLNQS